MHKLSTVIITFNEEEKIGRCIKSAQAISDEIIILDSYSTDKTTIIAKELGCKIFENEFLGFIKQRKLSISYASNELVLALDADEYLSPELINEIKLIKSNLTSDAFALNRLSSINGHWIRHGSWHPDFIIRLFKKSKIVNGGESPHDKIIPINGAQIKKLRGVLYHDAHDSIEDRIETIVKHSEVAAITKFNKGVKSNWVKAIIKTFWKFILEFLLKLGFLDGYYGWIAAKTTAQYIYLRERKIAHLAKSK